MTCKQRGLVTAVICIYISGELGVRQQCRVWDDIYSTSKHESGDNSWRNMTTTFFSFSTLWSEFLSEFLFLPAQIFWLSCSESRPAEEQTWTEPFVCTLKIRNYIHSVWEISDLSVVSNIEQHWGDNAADAVGHHEDHHPLPTPQWNFSFTGHKIEEMKKVSPY